MTKHMSADERCDQILEAARTCFLQNGYFATKMDDIALTAGLSKGGIYFHFESKEDIFRGLVQREYHKAMTFIDSVVIGEGDVVEKFVRIGDHFITLFASSENPRFMLIVGEMSLRDVQIQALLRELSENYERKIEELLRMGIEGGQLKPMDTAQVAMLLKSLIDGIQSSFAIGQQLDLERVLGAAADMVMRGLMTEQARARS